MSKFVNVSRLALTTVATLVGQAGVVLAQIQAPDVGQSSMGIKEIVISIGNWVLTIAGALAVVYLIYGGVMYITGGEKGAEKAKVVIINAIIGLVIVAIASSIVALIRRTLGA